MNNGSSPPKDGEGDMYRFRFVGGEDARAGTNLERLCFDGDVLESLNQLARLFVGGVSST